MEVLNGRLVICDKKWRKGGDKGTCGILLTTFRRGQWSKSKSGDKDLIKLKPLLLQRRNTSRNMTQYTRDGMGVEESLGTQSVETLPKSSQLQR